MFKVTDSQVGIMHQYEIPWSYLKWYSKGIKDGNYGDSLQIWHYQWDLIWASTLKTLFLFYTGLGAYFEFLMSM
jgi:hypothetical protein